MPIAAWAPNPYPAPRRDRGAGLTDTGLGVVPPAPRLWSAHIYTGAVARITTVVSPKFLGPALLRHLSYQASQSNAVGEQTELILLWSTDNTGQGNAAYGAAPPSGTIIPVGSFFGSGTQTASSYPNAIWLDSQAAPPLPRQVPLQYLVQANEFYLKACYTNPAGGGIVINLMLALYEQLDPNTLIDLMSGL